MALSFLPKMEEPSHCRASSLDVLEANVESGRCELWACRDLPPRIEQVPEPARVQALAAKPPMETLHAGVLGRGLVGLGVHYIDLAFNGPSQEVTAGFFRTVIAANRLRFAK